MSWNRNITVPPDRLLRAGPTRLVTVAGTEEEEKRKSGGEGEWGRRRVGETEREEKGMGETERGHSNI